MSFFLQCSVFCFLFPKVSFTHSNVIFMASYNRLFTSCAWLLSLNIMFLKRFSILYVLVSCSVFLRSTSLYEYTTNIYPSSMNVHLGCFQFVFVIRNKAIINICIRPIVDMILFHLDKPERAELEVREEEQVEVYKNCQML